MKKLLALLLSMVMILSLFAACDSDDDDDDKKSAKKGECEICAEEAKLYEVEKDGETMEVCKDCKRALQEYMEENGDEDDDIVNPGGAVVRPLPKPQPETDVNEEEELEEEQVQQPDYDFESMRPKDVKKAADALLIRYTEITDQRVDCILAGDWDGLEDTEEEYNEIFDLLMDSYMYMDSADMDDVHTRLNEQIDRITTALDAA